MNKNITIAGLGWLGQAFAAKLIHQKYKVKGSVTKTTKAQALSTQGIETYKMLLTETGTVGDLPAFFKDTDVLAIMVPPGIRRNTGTNYALKMAHFLHEIEASQIKKVILMSSTSVYDDSQGVVTEKNTPNPQLNAGKQLYDVEQIFFNAPSFKCSIVRFGGLYGGNRNPVRFLAGRKDLHNGEAPVNLIHREDCIGILTAIIEQDAFGHIFNAAIPQHPTKQEYYTKQATLLGLEPPHYEKKQEEVIFKQIDSVNVSAVLDYEYVHSLL